MTISRKKNWSARCAAWGMCWRMPRAKNRQCLAHALRLTALFATVSTVVLLVLGYLIGGTVEQHFVEQDIEVLKGKLDLTRHALERVRSEADLVAIPQHLDDSLVGHPGLAVVVVVAPDGALLFASNGAEFPEALLTRPISADTLNPHVWRTARNTADARHLGTGSNRYCGGFAGGRRRGHGYFAPRAIHGGFPRHAVDVRRSGGAVLRLSRLAGRAARVGAVAGDEAQG